MSMTTRKTAILLALGFSTITLVSNIAPATAASTDWQKPVDVSAKTLTNVSVSAPLKYLHVMREESLDSSGKTSSYSYMPDFNRPAGSSPNMKCKILLNGRHYTYVSFCHPSASRALTKSGQYEFQINGKTVAQWTFTKPVATPTPLPKALCLFTAKPISGNAKGTTFRIKRNGLCTGGSWSYSYEYTNASAPLGCLGAGTLSTSTVNKGVVFINYPTGKKDGNLTIGFYPDARRQATLVGIR